MPRDTTVIDACHFEACDQAPPKEEKSKTEPRKLGRKPHEERVQWFKGKAEKDANLPL